MDWLSPENVKELIVAYGYVAIGTIIALESMGLPLPGEGVLVAAALYAGHQNLSIAGVIACAAAGAIIGDNIGYAIGREFGYRLLLRYGSYIGLAVPKIKLGQYLFLRHGGKVVFLGRFVAVLRVLAAFLAGVNRMDWNRFLVANAAGAVVWASVVGLCAYSFGKAALHVQGPLGVCLVFATTSVVLAALIFIRRHEAELEAQAERALPGPLRQAHRIKLRSSSVNPGGS